MTIALFQANNGLDFAGDHDPRLVLNLSSSVADGKPEDNRVLERQTPTEHNDATTSSFHAQMERSGGKDRSLAKRGEHRSSREIHET